VGRKADVPLYFGRKQRDDQGREIPLGHALHAGKGDKDGYSLSKSCAAITEETACFLKGLGLKCYASRSMKIFNR